MKKTLILCSVLAIAIASTPSALAANVTTLTVDAVGANELNGGAKNASAKGTFILNKSKGTICSSVTTKGLTNIIGSHIHTGVKGVVAEIVVTIDALKINEVGTSCVKVAPALLADIAANPSSYYFNVHTKSFPGGAVRGQLVKK